MASTNGSGNGSTNGKARGKDKVRVAIVGVGNCANSLVQGVQYYKDAPDDQFVPGLMHVNLGGYHISDIEFTAAFDVTTDKVGKDLADAIWAHPNDTIKFADVPKTGITVNRGMTHDGLGKYISEVVTKAPGETDDIVGILRETQDRRRRQLPPGRLRGRGEVVRRAVPRGRRRARQLHAGLHRPRGATGRSGSRRRACRSSATTSSRRSARRSRTAC